MKENTYTSLARAIGQGSAGECPAEHDAKTPATRERVCHVVAATRDGGVVLPRESAQGTPREAIV